MSMNNWLRGRSEGGERGRKGEEDQPPRRLVTLFASVIVLSLMLLLIQLQGQAEASTARVVNLLPVGFAFAAGIITSVNPCGFLMLPTYLSYQLGTREESYFDHGVLERSFRALILGGVVTAGFIVVFGFAGAIIAAGGTQLVSLFPHAGLIIGIALMILGIWLLIRGENLGILAASRAVVAPQKNLINGFIFGMAYAVGSLSCTLPIFLAVVGSGIAAEGFVASLGSFLSYALGMGLVLITLTLTSALLGEAVINRIKGAIPYLKHASKVFLIGAGGYLIYYWVFFAEAFIR